jgi:hypothetical protein
MANSEKKIQALYNSFVFIGDVVFNEEKYYTSKVSDSGYKYSRLQFGVKTADGNVVYVDMMGGFSTTKKNVIYAMDKDKNKLEIDFNDRHDQKIIDSVMDFKKIKMNFGTSDEKDSKIFIAEYDAVEYAKANMQKGQRVVVIGNVNIERYKNPNDGKVITSMKYVPTKIRLAKEEEKNKAELKLNFVFDKESLEIDRLEKEGKMDVTGYFTTYNKDSKSNIFVQFPLVLDMEYLASISTVPLDDAKKKVLNEIFKKYFKANVGEYVETEWRAEVFRGSQQAEITMDDLSADQKMQIEVGLVTLEQVAKEMGARKAGDKINEIKLVRPTNKYEDEKGTPMVNKKTDLTEDDFIIKEVQEESKGDLFKPQDDSEQKSEADLLKGLFG